MITMMKKIGRGQETASEDPFIQNGGIIYYHHGLSAITEEKRPKTKQGQ
jgi:hypothetical protein